MSVLPIPSDSLNLIAFQKYIHMEGKEKQNKILLLKSILFIIQRIICVLDKCGKRKNMSNT